jgi:nucleoside phosphorylase
MRPETPGLTLVCFAVPEEAGPFRKMTGDRADVRILVTGMGARNARTAVSAALAQFSPGFVFTCGFAGGLRPGMKTGTVLFDCAEDSPVSSALRAAGACPGGILFSSRVAVTAAEKRELRETTSADAVEMESRVIREVCAESGIPSATLRVILDTAEEDLPLDFNALLTPDYKLDSRKLALEMARHPARIGALLSLRKQTREAAVRLAEVLGCFLRQSGK